MGARRVLTVLEHEHVTFMFKFLSERGDELRPSDLNWTIKLEDVYKSGGMLSERELEILQEIYERY